MELIIIAAGLILDRITKIWAIGNLKGQDIIVIKDFFGLSYLENRGAAFGIFQDKAIILAAVTLIIIGGMIYYIIRYKPLSMIFKVGSAMVISGALGNLFDRVYYNYVVDFLMLHYKNVYYFPTFNVADILVVVGTGLMVLYLLKEDSNGKI